MRTVAVLGANGQLGTDLCEAFGRHGWRVVPLLQADLDLETAPVEAMTAALEGAQAEGLVNTAAFHNVEKCESEPERAFAVNATGVRRLAQACAARGTMLIHISTDYVFDGAKGAPYIEEDTPNPLSVYANSKLAGEYFVRAIAERHAVVRSSGLYGRNPCLAKGGLNFPRTMLKLARERGEVKVVTDEFVTPTYTADLSEQIVRIAEAGATGLFHATPQGGCSWHEFAAAVFEVTGTKVTLHKAVSADFPPKVRRPSYSVLANAHLQRLGLDVMPPWRESLERYVRDSGGAL